MHRPSEPESLRAAASQSGDSAPCNCTCKSANTSEKTDQPDSTRDAVATALYIDIGKD